MNLCSDNHDEICFEGKDCPMCAVILEKEELEKELEEVKNN